MNHLQHRILHDAQQSGYVEVTWQVLQEAFPFQEPHPVEILAVHQHEVHQSGYIRRTLQFANRTELIRQFAADHHLQTIEDLQRKSIWFYLADAVVLAEKVATSIGFTGRLVVLPHNARSTIRMSRNGELQEQVNLQEFVVPPIPRSFWFAQDDGVVYFVEG